MASKGKKGGKKKGQTLNLTDFLGGDGGGKYMPPGAGATTTVAVGSNWADEMEEGDGFEGGERMERAAQQVVLPTAPRAALGPGIDDDRIPKRPPYTAYIANLPYDVDEDQVKEVFVKAKLKINTVRLMKDEGGRLKGYGYADFDDRDSLVDVLTLSDLAVNNRKMRIDLASQAGKDKGGFGDRPGREGDRPGRDEDPNAGRADADNEWRRGPAPAPSNDSGRDRDRGGGDRYGGRDSYDRDRNSGRDGGDRNDRYGGRDSYDRDRGGSRGFSNYEPPKEGGGGFGDRDGGRWGRDRDGGRDSGRDSYRDGGREREQPKERPKLQLAARSTKPAEEGEAKGQSSSIFGGAKPVDTLSKEKEMEEKKKVEAPKPRSSGANPFGSAKPIDTAQREKEIEEKLSKLDVKSDDKRGDYGRSGGGSSAWGKSDEKRGYGDRDRRDDRRDDRDRGYGDRRGDDKGRYGGGGGESRRGDERSGSGYDRDRRDDRGYDRDRRDDRGYSRERRDDRGGSGYDRDRRDDRAVSGSDRDRRDDGRSSRDGDRREDGRSSRDGDRREDGRSSRDEERGSDRRDGHGESDKDHREVKDSSETEKKEPQMKKYEEAEPPVVVAANKYAFLSEEGEGSEGEGNEASQD